MSGPIVADAGPLIGLARVGLLSLLRALFQTVIVPARVAEELRLDDDRPGARALRTAVEEGWLAVDSGEPAVEPLAAPELDPGEIAAIDLAARRESRFLLIDDRLGRSAARRRGIPVVGVAGVLLAAKQRGLLAEVRPALAHLADGGYHLSPELVARVLELAGEG